MFLWNLLHYLILNKKSSSANQEMFCSCDQQLLSSADCSLCARNTRLLSTLPEQEKKQLSYRNIPLSFIYLSHKHKSIHLKFPAVLILVILSCWEMVLQTCLGYHLTSGRASKRLLVIFSTATQCTMICSTAVSRIWSKEQGQERHKFLLTDSNCLFL